MNKINFRIKIEIFTFTSQGREKIIDKKIIENQMRKQMTAFVQKAIIKIIPNVKVIYIKI